MRIVLVYDQLNTGGTEKLFVMIANLLHEHHHQVTVVLIRQPATLDAFINHNIPVVYLNRKNKFGFRAMKLLADTCRNADVVHVHTYYNWRYVYTATLMFKVNAPRFILHEHSDMQHLNAVDRMILPKLDRFIAVNPAQATSANKLGLTPDHVLLLPNIVKALHQDKIAHDCNQQLIMVGNIRKEKNYEFALALLQQLPGFSLDIYGNINDKEYFKQLQELIDEKQLNGRVHFITNEHNVVQHFAKYDLALHTSSNETGPLVLLEYLSAGLPFFCSSAGQSPALIRQYLPAFVLSTFNTCEWMDAIKNFYAQPREASAVLQVKMKEATGALIDVNA